MAGSPRWLTHPGESRAKDVHPGGGNPEELHRYWVAGPGLAKWRGSPTPWRTLRRHLAKYIPNPDELTRTTSKWFQEVFGFAAGSDLNRVTHGHPPRGHKVGPG